MRTIVLLAAFTVASNPAAGWAQARHVAAELPASRPAPASPDTAAAPGRTFALSLSAGVGIAKWTDYVAYFNEKERRYETVELSGRSFVVAELTGFAGVVFAAMPSSRMEHIVGYVLAASAEDTAVLHRHHLAYRLDSPLFGLTAGVGLSVITPWGGAPSQTGAGIGLGVHVYLAGPLFAEFHYLGDMIGTDAPIMKTYGLTIGLANL